MDADLSPIVAALAELDSGELAALIDAIIAMSTGNEQQH